MANEVDRVAHNLKDELERDGALDQLKLTLRRIVADVLHRKLHSLQEQPKPQPAAAAVRAAAPTRARALLCSFLTASRRALGFCSRRTVTRTLRWAWLQN